jgi:integrase
MDGERSKDLETLWREMIAQKSPEWKKATLQTYNKSWNVVFSRFWPQQTELTAASVLAFKSWYLTEFPTREPSKIKIHLQVFWNYLDAIKARENLPDLSPLNDLTKIIQKNTRREKVGRALSKAETDRLIEAACFYHVDWAGAAVLLSLSAGLRKMEILLCDKFNFDREKLVLKVWSQKNSKWREIPLNEALGSFFGSKILNYLISSSSSRPYSSEAFQKHWLKIKSAAGISGRLRFHDLRHSFATRTAEAGWSPIGACEILDMSLKVYQGIYAKPSIESKRELFKRL